MFLFQLDIECPGLIVKRPSASCKTPYVADVLIQPRQETNCNDDRKTYMAHCPSLGCCGHADNDSIIYLSKLESAKTKCDFRVELAYLNETKHNIHQEIIIGINPKLGETIAEHALTKNCVLGLTNIRDFKREVTYINSRFDFMGHDENGQEFIMEVKNVPLADYVDVPKKERKKYKDVIESKNINDKIAYFPDGYRKSTKDVVSPRALKHIEELEELKKTKNIRTILCYIVERQDVSSFQPSFIDPTYRAAVIKAAKAGVEIKTIQVCWEKNGSCSFVRNDLPINLDE